MKIETLEEVLHIDTDSNKAPDNKRLLVRIKQLIKKQQKLEESNQVDVSQLPYEAVSVVGNRYVKINFDLKSNQAKITENTVDERPGFQTQSMMAAHKATEELKSIFKKQRNIECEE